MVARESQSSPALSNTTTLENTMKYGLLWLLGIPVPILIIAYLIWH